VPHPSLTLWQTGVVIREGDAGAYCASPFVKKEVKEEPQPPSSFLHFRHPKKEPVVKKEHLNRASSMPLMKKEKLWWEEELEL
jgi:hypothetical protein